MGPEADDGGSSDSYSPAMFALRTSVLLIWIVFWLYWLIAAVESKHSAHTGRARLPGLTIVVMLLVIRIFKPDTVLVHSLAVEVAGMIVFVAGLGLAVWARIYLGRNWGMPMTQKDEPELVTSGPYRFVRHPIYSGILLGILGSAIATNVYWLIALAVVGPYFIYSATVEERNMASTFPTAYPSYKAATKMLIPFVL
jgi:protein-S-isoprenylcysteine O-methyltransferase Ste14